MPYVMPSTSPETPHLDLPPLKLRPRHRRSRSATTNFSAEKGPGAFVSLPNLPRRKGTVSNPSDPRRTLFHFKNDEQEDGDSDSSDEFPRRPSPPPSSNMNALGLTVDTQNLPTNAPSSIEPSRPLDEKSCLPFPAKGSPLPSPSPPSPTSSSALPRTPSTPIILSNGKRLKPSLKSSQSSPNIPGVHLHTRAQSEPSTPCGTVKNVHFPEKDGLQSVRVFNSSGRPVNVNGAGDETETETEYDSSNTASEASNGFPFPVASSSAAQNSSFELRPDATAQIPQSNPPEYANVHFEDISLPRSRPLALRGSILVRNVTFAKEVAVRFTLDDWQTTSEVICKHVTSLPGLPPPFPMPSTTGDLAAQASGHGNTWDRFSFSIALEDFERKLTERTMWMVVRYTAVGAGEWWDNNSGRNYHVGFRKVQASVAAGSGGKREVPTVVVNGDRDGPTTRVSPVMGNSQQRTFSAPPTLKGTPTTEAVQAIAQAEPFAGRRHGHHGLAARPPMMARSQSSPQPMSLASMPNGRLRAVPMHHSLPTKLNLLNYSAPSTSPPSTRTATAEGLQFVGLSDASPDMGMGLVNGMPATAPRYDYAWSHPPSHSHSTSNAPAATETNSNPPSPPPSYSALPHMSHGNNSPPATDLQKAQSPSPINSTSPYAALLKQWCFAQSPTPSPVQTPALSGSPSPAAALANGGVLPTATNERDARWLGIGGMDAYLNGLRSDSPSPMLAGL